MGRFPPVKGRIGKNLVATLRIGGADYINAPDA